MTENIKNHTEAAGAGIPEKTKLHLRFPAAEAPSAGHRCLLQIHYQPVYPTGTPKSETPFLRLDFNYVPVGCCADLVRRAGENKN